MKESNRKIVNFFRANATYLVLALCVLAIGLSVVLMMVGHEDNAQISVDKPIEEVVDPNKEDVDPKPDVPDVPEVPKKTVNFIIPVENCTEINHYSETAVFSSTLSHYTAHLATDFFSEEGAKVYAVYDGTVESVTNDVLNGYTVTIDHGDGLKTVYNSLSEDVSVKSGDTVVQGTVIGEVSTTNRREYKEGAHLHFETLENGVKIDCAKYMDFDNK